VVVNVRRWRQSRDDLDQFHQRHGIHEVHPDDLLRALGGGGDLGDRNGRCVGRQNHAFMRVCVHVFEDLEFQLWVFRRSFDDKSASFIVLISVTNWIASAEAFCSACERALFQQFRRGFGNGRPGFFQRGGLHIHAGDLVARCRRNLRDAVAHGPCADDKDSLMSLVSFIMSLRGSPIFIIDG
jgi:hypothetical protein